jgi:N-acetylglucosamine-6-sulfatase
MLGRKGVAFIDQAAASRQPFFLELATFAPHRPYVPAPRDLPVLRGLKAPRPPSFGVLPTNAPRWLQSRPPLTSSEIAEIDQDYRLRAQAVQAVDRMIGLVQRALAANHITRDTYLIFSSDNGLHMGQYRLTPGKLTAFDTDIRVPLVVVGPGVPAGAKTTKLIQNIDLAPTFAALGGARLQADGHSLVGLLHGDKIRRWRNAILVEHRGPLRRPQDPDYQGPVSGNPPSYEAMRTHRFLYVEYKDGEREYYDLKEDPFELYNLADSLPPTRLAMLHWALSGIEHCHTATACWNAMHVVAHQ